jgi:hypothetical protein
MIYSNNTLAGRHVTRPAPRNALLQGALPSRHAPSPRAPNLAAAIIANAIAHAAMLSDTPEKWAATLDMLRRNGIDPSGYDDFKKGRALAMASAGGTAPEMEEAEYQR